jgi:hypothetical protein
MTPVKEFLKNTLYFVNKNPYQQRKFKEEIDKRANLSFGDIEGLANYINLYSPFTNEIHKANDYYGHATILKKFLGLNNNHSFKFVMEHGVYLDDQVASIDLDNKFSTIITCSSYRKPVLKKHYKKVYTIGPYFHYAEHLLSEDKLRKEKKRLGKTLLVFPSHSAPGIEAKFSVENLCQQIKGLKKEFETIRICLYWQDVLKGAAEIYQSYGFECVSAGHVIDPNFLNRLKTIIELSDETASNDIGASIGYCILMNKPHFILKQPLHFKGTKYQVGLVEEYHSSKTYKEIMSAFSKRQNKITKEQNRVTDFFWGTKDIKTRREILKIVEKAEKRYSLGL